MTTLIMQSPQTAKVFPSQVSTILTENFPSTDDIKGTHYTWYIAAVQDAKGIVRERYRDLI